MRAPYLIIGTGFSGCLGVMAYWAVVGNRPQKGCTMKKGEHRPESEQQTACSERDEDTAYAWNAMASCWTQGKGR